MLPHCLLLLWPSLLLHIQEPIKPTSKVSGVETAIQEALKIWQVPGVALAMIEDDQVRAINGYGVRQLGKSEPVTPDTIFPIASCTKAFTTALIAKLVDDEQMNWDDPVRQHYPTFRLQNRAADALVSIRDLVTHRSGLGGHDLMWYRASWSNAEVLRRIADVPLSAPFRSVYQYSSLPFMAAGRAVEIRGRASWESQMQRNICEPLGMKNVRFTTTAARQYADRASGHERTKDGKIIAMKEYVVQEPNPAGSMYLSAADMVPWLRMQLSRGKLGDQQILTEKQFQEMHQAHIPMRLEGMFRTTYPDSHQVSYGMGWVIYDHRGEMVIAHGGTIDGFRVQVTLLPKRNFGFALLNNLHKTKMNIALSNTIIDLWLNLPKKDWNAYYQKIDEEEAKEAAKKRQERDTARQANTQPSVPLANYLGDYTDPAYGPGKIIWKDDHFEWHWSSFVLPLEHWQHDEFRVTSGYFADDIIKIDVKNGSVNGLALREMRFQKK